MTRDELLRRYRDGERSFPRADLRGADLVGAYLRETRLHPSGTWSAVPPRCSAGDWHAIVTAPSLVRIGCTELTVEHWLGDAGVRLAGSNHASDDDVATLRQWMLRLSARTEWPGWTPDGEVAS